MTDNFDGEPENVSEEDGAAWHPMKTKRPLKHRMNYYDHIEAERIGKKHRMGLTQAGARSRIFNKNRSHELKLHNP